MTAPAFGHSGLRIERLAVDDPKPVGCCKVMLANQVAPVCPRKIRPQLYRTHVRMQERDRVQESNHFVPSPWVIQPAHRTVSSLGDWRRRGHTRPPSARASQRLRA